MVLGLPEAQKKVPSKGHFDGNALFSRRALLALPVWFAISVLPSIEEAWTSIFGSDGASGSVCDAGGGE